MKQTISMNKTISLSVKDAPQMNAYVSLPSCEGPFPAVMVFQEAFGVNQHIRDVADRLAAEGYLAISPELFHRTAEPGFESGYTDFSLVQPHFSVLTTENLENDVQATYDWLQSQDNIIKDKIACIGFCLGGRVSFIANTFLPLKASISFYGGYTHTIAGRAVNMQGPHLFFWAGKDNHIFPEHVQTVNDAVKNAGKDYISVTISYAEHAFENNDRTAYHPQAAAEAWGMVNVFLKNKLR